MFTKLVRSSAPVNFVFLPVIILSGWWMFFSGMNTISWSTEKSILLPLLPEQVFSQPWCIVISLAFSLFTSLLTIPFTIKYFHNTSGNLLPAVLFLAILAPVQWLFNSGPVIISLFFCMLALRYIFETYHQVRVFHFGFMAGFLTSLATLIYWPSVIFIGVCWIGIILIKSFSFREFLIIVIGFLIPFIFTYTIFIMLNKEQQLLSLVQTLFIKTSFPAFEINQIVWLSFICILCLWGIVKSIASDILKKIIIRRYFETLVLALILFISAFIIFYPDFGLLSMIILPSSFILAIALFSIKNPIYPSLFILFLIMLQIATQISLII